jgi:hypothetical protein
MHVGAVAEPQSYLPVGFIHRRPTMAPVTPVPSRRSAGDGASSQLEEDPGPKLLVDLNLVAPRPVEARQPVGVQQNAPTERSGECQTCARRKYQDKSDDASVSFQMPTSLSPAQAEVMVRVHEGEHVQHERAKAAREGKEVETRVSIHYSICPECGRVYCSGGTTQVETREPADTAYLPDGAAAAPQPSPAVSPASSEAPPTVDLVA